METTKRILWNKFNKSDNKSEWLDYIKTVSEEWYDELSEYLKPKKYLIQYPKYQRPTEKYYTSLNCIP